MTDITKTESFFEGKIKFLKSGLTNAMQAARSYARGGKETISVANGDEIEKVPSQHSTLFGALRSGKKAAVKGYHLTEQLGKDIISAVNVRCERTH